MMNLCKLAALSLLVLCSGCGGLLSSSGSAHARGVNAIPGSGSLTMLVGDTTVLSGGSYFSGSGVFFTSVNAATNTISAIDTGSSIVASSTESFSNGDYKTTYACGTTSSPQLYTAADNINTPTSGYGRVHFIQLASDRTTASSTAVDVYIKSSSVTTGFGTNLDFKSDASIDIAAGTYTVSVYAYGTTVNPLATYDITVSSGGRQTVVFALVSGSSTHQMRSYSDDATS